jgi:hypothetical protein
VKQRLSHDGSDLLIVGSSRRSRVVDEDVQPSEPLDSLHGNLRLDAVGDVR